jgi:serine/threonine-protein kinase
MKAGRAATRDWALGIAVALSFGVVAQTNLSQSLERKAYDIGVAASDRVPSDRIAVIAIDDASVRALGRWPWPREVHARFTERLAAGAPKAIGSLVFFSEPEGQPGLAYLQRIGAEVHKAGDGMQPAGDTPLARIGHLVDEGIRALDGDRSLAEAYASAGNVFLPMFFQIGAPRGRPEAPLPGYVVRNAVQSLAGDDAPLSTLDGAAVPTASIGEAAAGLGHLSAPPDVDGVLRVEPLVLEHFGHVFPSLSVRLAAHALNLPLREIETRSGAGLSLGGLLVPADAGMMSLTHFYADRGARPAFGVDSFLDVYAGKVPPQKYRDRIVLVGPTAAGLGTTFATPVSPAMPPVLVLAHNLSSILEGHTFVVPRWARWAELVAFVAVALYLALLAPRLAAGPAALATASAAASLVAVEFGLLVGRGLWLQLMLPLTMLLTGHLLLTTRRFLATEGEKAKSVQDSAASHRMLGLAFQGQGQLDLAFDAFRKCPVDDPVLENLYTLALDFERKRQFNKAEEVFRYVAERRPDFRDAGARVERAHRLSETVILGGAVHASDGLNLGGGVERPMLGRYRIEQEIGKGAMGAVYLGRDPKIGRVVAIKTLALGREFEGEELEEVKARFFREAETAGRLTHPNIVTIFDAGEEQDLAYIAMEFVQGRDLGRRVSPATRLPVDTVVAIVAQVAEALGYAHRHHVVHRDVKPANIMWDPESERVKVTDFGIARITDASRTRTGMVLGTPAYMSPEQLAGKRIDGRSDLFSLAVTLYELVAGVQPFAGESMAQLMFRIANNAAPDISTIVPGVPDALDVFMRRALAKDPAERFATGDAFAAALRGVLEGTTTVPAIGQEQARAA